MFNEKSYNQKMDKTFDVFIKELTSLRQVEQILVCLI